MNKARLYEPGRESQAVTVQFNPNSLEYTLRTGANGDKGTMSAASESAAREPQQQNDPTGAAEKAVLPVRLFYHTYTSSAAYSDVREEIKKLRQFVRQSGNTARTNASKVTFAWGTLLHTGMMNSFSVRYQMFAADGTPVQAEVSLSITGEEADRTLEQEGKKAADDRRAADPLLAEWGWLYE